MFGSACETPTLACVYVCGAPRSVRLCSLLSEALGGPSCDSLESLLGASWAPLGSLLGCLRVSWEALGRLKGTLRALAHEFCALGAAFGASWEALGSPLDPLGNLLGASWESLGPSWETLGSHLGRLGTLLGAFGSDIKRMARWTLY